MAIVGGASDVVALPFLNKYISMIDESSIPIMAHSIVDNAIEKGELLLADGALIIEEADLKTLKRLLELNLPLAKEDVYIVKTE